MCCDVLYMGGQLRGECVHGLRVGLAIRTMLEGAGDIREVMAKGLWRSPEMAEHYMKLYKILEIQDKTSDAKVRMELGKMRPTGTQSPGIMVADYHLMNVESMDEGALNYIRACGHRARTGYCVCGWTSADSCECVCC
jgi:hypothetical protein